MRGAMEMDALIRDLWVWHPRVRDAAVAALLQRGAEAVEPLIEALKTGFSPAPIAEVLGRIGDPRAAVPLTRLLAAADDVTLEAAGNALLALGEAAVVPLLRAERIATYAEMRQRAKGLLELMEGGVLARGIRDALAGDDESLVPLVRAFLRDHPALRARVVRSWASGWPPSLNPLLRGPHLWMRLCAAEAVGRTGEAAHLGRFAPLLGHDDTGVVLTAAVGLAYLSDPRGIPALADGLRHREEDVRIVCAEALGHLGAQAGAALGVLRDAGHAGPADVRAACRAAVRDVTEDLRRAPAELEAASAPAGRGTELSSGTTPAGRGTELESNPAAADADGGLPNITGWHIPASLSS